MFPKLNNEKETKTKLRNKLGFVYSPKRGLLHGVEQRNLRNLKKDFEYHFGHDPVDSYLKFKEDVSLLEGETKLFGIITG